MLRDILDRLLDSSCVHDIVKDRIVREYENSCVFIAILDIHGHDRVFRGNSLDDVQKEVYETREKLFQSYPNGHFPATYYVATKVRGEP